MTLPNNTQFEDIHLSAATAKAVKDLLAKRELEGYALRVFVSGGGCSGLQYGMALEGSIRPEDTNIELHGVKVVIDEVSYDHLRGAVVDYVEDVMASGFKIENPNAVSTCSCGSSFGTEEKGIPNPGVCGC